MIGYMGNNLLPLRAGEIVRVYVVARRGYRFLDDAAPVLFEPVLDGLALGLIVAALFLVIPISAVSSDGRRPCSSPSILPP